MPYIISKKRTNKRTKKQAMDEGLDVSYDPINIVKDYDEARRMIEADSSLILSYSSSEILAKYPDNTPEEKV